MSIGLQEIRETSNTQNSNGCDPQIVSIKIENVDFATWKTLPKKIKNDPCFKNFQVMDQQFKANTFHHYKASKDDIGCYLDIGFMYSEENSLKQELLAVGANNPYVLKLPNDNQKQRARFCVEGYFGDSLDENTADLCEDCLLLEFYQDYIESKIQKWTLSTVKFNGFIPRPVITKRCKDISFNDFENKRAPIEVCIGNKLEINFPINFSHDLNVQNQTYLIILSGVVLVILYGVISCQVVYRTFASVLSCAFAVVCLVITCLAIINDRPTMNEIMNWIDFDTILLLLCMMIITEIFTETGVFDYLARFVYRFIKGHIRAFIHSMCLLITIASVFLNNVTTTFLFTPVIIKLCEMMELDPVPVLMMMMIHANIGGSLSPFGYPPNVLITSNPDVVKYDITFMSFIKWMGIGVILCSLSATLVSRLMYPFHKEDREKTIGEWKDVLKSLESSLESYIELKTIIEDKINQLCSNNVETFERKLERLKQKDYLLLIKTFVVLLFVIFACLIQFALGIQRLSLSWCALLGLLLLLIISKKNDINVIMSKVDWSALLFFASIFIMIEIVDRCGLIKLICDVTNDLILSVQTAYQLSLAIIIVLWITGIASAFIGSIPVTAIMVRVVVSIANNEELGLPLPPLIWALAFGQCLGGNGTLLGAPSNIFCAGLAQQRGYRIRFNKFFNGIENNLTPKPMMFKLKEPFKVFIEQCDVFDPFIDK
uniref:CSON012835 protein n=1 Tax=Culicoides sonorensis TaxID=179676 RepID=A0A336M6Q5_CULSO